MLTTASFVDRTDPPTFPRWFGYLNAWYALLALPGAQRYAGEVLAVNYAAFGLVMVLFLVFEPLGLVGVWRRIQTYFLLWPFRHRPVAGPRQ